MGGEGVESVPCHSVHFILGLFLGKISPTLFILSGMFLYVLLIPSISFSHLLPLKVVFRTEPRDFPGGLVIKNLPCNAVHMGSLIGELRSHLPKSN